jgi:hypothetical protein
LKFTSTIVSLTPGFSPVNGCVKGQNRFNGFLSAHPEAVETARPPAGLHTRLKPGVNEKVWIVSYFCGHK